MSNSPKPPVRFRLVITAGDPCGVGPEVILKALAGGGRPSVPLLVIGDLAVFEETARRAKLPLPRWRLASSPAHAAGVAHQLVFLDLGHRWRFVPGRPSARAGEAAAAYLDAAIALLRRGWANGLVTAPVTKWAIERSRGRFEGQTEYLARALHTPRVLMMFVSDRLRVALLTRHVALREVPRRLTQARVREAIVLAAEGLRRHFGIRHPRLAVCGLNPHAGEAGLFGSEERRVLAPALEACRRRGIRIEGPFAADGFFAGPRDYDAVLCGYHDQGLIPFKLLSRDRGCQLTVGLPVVRTSPDHGSALDIAGQGRAHPGSMRYALRLAATLLSRVHSR
ncbi:MAG: 4-hydroxythreonine-4-phosphate dehydrogenase PdxA [Candidatus Omnitrophica bacterium]|nr:4-hydroxythreonine-4-phosphate dehydrogenase PdxA [Candidatus Omnitrophota bacterium]